MRIKAWYSSLVLMKVNENYSLVVWFCSLTENSLRMSAVNAMARSSLQNSRFEFRT